jgi:hypothetical protein
VPEVPKYTVKFDTAHGTTPASITVESGTKLTAEQLKALPDTEDNIFEGWYDGETQAKGGEYTVTKDVTLVAKWRNRDTVDSVTFDPSSTKLYYGDTVTVTLSTTTEYATIKYRLDDSEDWKTYNEAISITSDTNITAYATKAGLKDSAETTASYTVRTLKGITVTPPTRTVYSVGESFDGSDMVVTATYDDESSREVTVWTTNFDDVTSEKGVNKKVTVSYTEGEIKKQDSFTVVVFPEGVKILTDYTSPNHTDDTWTYVEFGEWPQTKANVEGISLQQVVDGRGYFKDNYYTDGKGNYYVKVTANPYKNTYKYSDETVVTEDSEVYFKVEPIIWRVLNSKDGEYNESENPLLLAENILTGGIPYYVDKNERTITGAGTKEGKPNIVYLNNYKYSTTRAWLNGKAESNDTQEKNKAYEEKGFLQTAFTPEAQGLITPTTVDNSVRSTNPESNATLWNSGKNEYACENTTDKIFLLSEQEATMSDYGFADYNVYVGDSKGTTTSTRIRVNTDYAKATGVYQDSEAGLWWLRSPSDSSEDFVRRIRNDGSPYTNYVYKLEVGIVPALCIALQ